MNRKSPLKTIYRSPQMFAMYKEAVLEELDELAAYFEKCIATSGAEHRQKEAYLFIKMDAYVRYITKFVKEVEVIKNE